MKIYLDYIFFENLVINLLIIYQISFCIKIKPKILNNIIAVILIAAYTTLTYAIENTFVESIFIKILMVAVVIYIAYIPKNIKEYIKQQAYYYLISFLYVGIIISITLLFNISIEKLYIKLIVYVISFVILYLLSKKMWKMWKSNIKNDDLTYTLNVKGQEILAFVDTGNTVRDHASNLDVIFVSQKYKTIFKKMNILSERISLDFNTIAGSNVLKGYVIKDIQVIKKGIQVSQFKKMIFVFVERQINENYNALISYDTYIEKLKGVTL